MEIAFVSVLYHLERAPQTPISAVK